MKFMNKQLALTLLVSLGATPMTTQAMLMSQEDFETRAWEENNRIISSYEQYEGWFNRPFSDIYQDDNGVWRDAITGLDLERALHYGNIRDINKHIESLQGKNPFGTELSYEYKNFTSDDYPETQNARIVEKPFLAFKKNDTWHFVDRNNNDKHVAISLDNVDFSAFDDNKAQAEKYIASVIQELEKQNKKDKNRDNVKLIFATKTQEGLKFRRVIYLYTTRTVTFSPHNTIHEIPNREQIKQLMKEQEQEDLKNRN